MRLDPKLLVTTFATLILQACTPPAPIEQTGPIKIQRNPPSTSIRVLDNLYWPQGKACGRAYTYWPYICRSDFKLEYLPALNKNDGKFFFDIKAIEIKLDLPLVVWLPYMVSDKLRHHELGHCTMCEDIYKDADKIALQCGQDIIKRRIEVHGYDLEDAKQAAYRKARATLDSDYRQKTAGIADRCGEIYDRITNHGMNDVKESDAMKMAFAEFKSSPHK